MAFISMGRSISVCGLIRTPFMPKRQDELDDSMYGVTVLDFPTTGGLWVCGSEDRKSGHLWELFLCHVS